MWLEKVENGLPKGVKYHKLHHVRLVGIMLVVHVRETLLPNITDVGVGYVSTGIMGMLGMSRSNVGLPSAKTPCNSIITLIYRLEIVPCSRISCTVYSRVRNNWAGMLTNFGEKFHPRHVHSSHLFYLN